MHTTHHHYGGMKIFPIYPFYSKLVLTTGREFSEFFQRWLVLQCNRTQTMIISATSENILRVKTPKPPSVHSTFKKSGFL